MIDYARGTLDREGIDCLVRQCGIFAHLGKGADMPPEFVRLQRESVKLSETLAAAVPVPVELVAGFCDRQGKLAAAARDVLAPAVQARRDAVEATLTALRAKIAPTGKGIDPALAGAAAAVLVDGGRVRGEVEAAAGIDRLANCHAVCRDNAAKPRPRWLVSELAQHERRKVLAAE